MRRRIDPQLQRIIEASLAWARGSQPDLALRVPETNAGSRHLLSLVHERVNEPELPNWTYHGVTDRDGNSLIVVEYDDGDRTLLRDREAGARGLFAWGYGGSGPHALADSLASHLVGSLLRCTDCLGASPAAAGLISCTACHNSGSRPGLHALRRLLFRRVVSDLPMRSQASTSTPTIVWTKSRIQLLQRVIGRA